MASATYTLTRDLAWKSQALLCRHPCQALSAAMGLPEDIINEIIVHYVGLFTCHRPYREVCVLLSMGTCTYRFFVAQLNMSTIRQLRTSTDVAGNRTPSRHLLLSIAVAVLSAMAYFFYLRVAAI